VTANLLVHYLVCGAKAGLDPHPLFDGSWYLQQNPAVARAGINPLVHYLREGAAAGCNPNPLFDTATYAAANLPGAPVSQALAHFAAGKRLVAAGAYRNADVLLALQSELRARTETQLVRDRRDQPRPFAVFLQCGHGSVHPRWLTSAPRNWDLIVNHYDSTFLDRIDCDVELVQAGELAGTKFTAVCSMLRRWPALLRAYDFILLLDDDIYIELGDIEKLFTAAVENGLDLAQASLSPDSACAHEVFLTQRRNGLRYVSAVEIMMPLLSRRALDVADPLFCQSISGWGIDVALAHLLRERYGSNFAVLDGVVARHTKPIDTEEGSYYKMLRGARIYPELELGHLQALYGTSLCFQEVSHLG